MDYMTLKVGAEK